MKTCAQIKSMILSAPDLSSANEIIDKNYDFKTYKEKIAFLNGMFGTDCIDDKIVEQINNTHTEESFYTFLNAIRTYPPLDITYVRKNITIPSWLNNLAMKENINFSQTMQEALKEKLGLK